MHILQVGPYPPPEGGVSRNMLAIRDELFAGGHMCSIVASARSSRVTDEPDVYHPKSAFSLIRLIVKLKFDILHLHLGGDVTPRVLALAFGCAVLGRGRSVVTLHSGAYPQTKKGRCARRLSLRGFIFRRFARIVAVNDALTDVFLRYGVAAVRIKRILPFSLRQPDDDIAVPENLREFCMRHDPLLLAVGGLEKDYDPMFQIAAMRDILEEFPNAGLMIVGDGSMRVDVQKSAATSGYAENIYIAGNVEHAVTLHLIAGADILLRTTLFDGDAISVREALFLGTPVIATDNGMRPDGVRLIGIGDKDALVREICSLAENKTSVVTAADSGKSNIAAIIDLYEELL